MQLTTTQNQAERLLFIASLTVIIFISAFAAIWINDIIVSAGTIVLIGFYLIYETDIEPVNLFYAICFGASFLPYVNLKIFPLAGVYIIAVLFIPLTLISFLKNARKIKFPQPAKWMFLFLFLGLLSIARAPDKKQVIVYAVQFFVYICIYIGAANVLKKKEQIIRAIKYVLIGSIFPLLASLAQFIVSLKSLQTVIDIFYQSIWGQLFMGSHGIERVSGDAMILINRGVNVGGQQGDVLFRMFGTYVSPTGFGGYIMLIAVLAGALLIVQRDKKRITFSTHTNFSILAALILCLILTWTRSGWVAFLIAFAFIIAYKKEQAIKIFTKKNILLFFFIIAIPAILFIILLIFKAPLATSVLLSIPTMSGGSIAGRLGTILFSLQYISQHPFAGIGWGNFAFVKPNFSFTPGTSTFATAHNRYLEMGVEFGIQGPIVFLIIIYAFIKQPLALIKAPVKSFYHTLGIAFLAMWIGFLIVSLFAGSVIHPRTMTILWALAGIQTAAYYQFLDERKKEHTVYHLEAAD